MWGGGGGGGVLPMSEKITELIHCMWRKEAIPQEYKEILKSLKTREASPSYPLLGRYWQKISCFA